VRSKRHFITSTLDASTSVFALSAAIARRGSQCLGKARASCGSGHFVPMFIGRDAKLIGAAFLPLHAHFSHGHESFLGPAGLNLAIPASRLRR
jgi:hypothetical protein